MARNITALFAAEVEAAVLSPALFVKAEFDSGDILAWTGVGNKVLNGDTYQGVGHFLGISSVDETQALQANSIEVALAGIPSSLISLALDPTEYQWRTITIYFAVLDSAGAIIADAYQIWKGKMDVMEINDDGATSTIVVKAENVLIGLKENIERSYTPEDQKITYPTDEGLDFVPLIQDIAIVWGTG